MQSPLKGETTAQMQPSLDEFQATCIRRNHKNLVAVSLPYSVSLLFQWALHLSNANQYKRFYLASNQIDSDIVKDISCSQR